MFFGVLEKKESERREVFVESDFPGDPPTFVEGHDARTLTNEDPGPDDRPDLPSRSSVLDGLRVSRSPQRGVSSVTGSGLNERNESLRFVPQVVQVGTRLSVTRPRDTE